MVNQPKRINGITSTFGALTSKHARFGPGTGTIIRRLTNYHNIWFGASVEPENTDANSNGTWVLWLKPDAAQADPAWTFANLSDGLLNMQVIACGTWAATNQTPWNFSSQLKTSRNLVANQELVMSVQQEGISAGNARVNIILCASLSVK